MDIIVGEGRRRWSEEEKRAIVAEVLSSGEPVSRVARRYNLSPSMLFTWRKLYSNAAGAPALATNFTPVVITSSEVQVPRDEKSQDAHPVMELDFESGARLRVQGSADPELVKAVIKAMTRR
jgi:transposase